jgi:hypothetical protein
MSSLTMLHFHKNKNWHSYLKITMNISYRNECMFPNKDDISAPLNYTNCLFSGVHSLYKLVAFSVTTYITILV